MYLHTRGEVFKDQTVDRYLAIDPIERIMVSYLGLSFLMNDDTLFIGSEGKGTSIKLGQMWYLNRSLISFLDIILFESSISL